MSDSLSKPFDESHNLFGIASLIYKSCLCAFCQQFSCSFLDLFQCAAKTVNKGWRGERSASVPGQLLASSCLLGVSIDSCCSDVPFEPFQLGFEILNLLPDILEFLRPSMSVVHDSNPLHRYLIMLDERVHPAEGGLERREPIGGLLRYVEENLYSVHDSLPLC